MIDCCPSSKLWVALKGVHTHTHTHTHNCVIPLSTDDAWALRDEVSCSIALDKPPYNYIYIYFSIDDKRLKMTDTRTMSWWRRLKSLIWTIECAHSLQLTFIRYYFSSHLFICTHFISYFIYVRKSYCMWHSRGFDTVDVILKYFILFFECIIILFHERTNGNYRPIYILDIRLNIK